MTKELAIAKVDKYIQEFKALHDAEVVYIAYSGSRLYGTYTEASDHDVKGIFIPSNESLKLKTDIPHYTRTTGNNNSSNNGDDIDFILISIHTFLAQLSKSETGAIEILYSMFAPETILLENKAFTYPMKGHHSLFQTKEISSFVGYALGQTKKFNHKGKRYAELVKFIEYFENHVMVEEALYLGSYFVSMRDYLDLHFDYIGMILDKGPKASNNDNIEIPYLTILGKKYAGSVTVEKFYKLIVKLEKGFGDRTRATAKSGQGDWKALSHAYRITREIEELIATGEIQFPLAYKDKILEIKQGKANFEEILTDVEDSVTDIRNQVKKSNKPRSVTPAKVQELLLTILEIKCSSD